MEKIKLEEGQVWQVPDKKWIRVRAIDAIDSGERCYDRQVRQPIHPICQVGYVDLGYGEQWRSKRSFLSWIRRNKAKIIGMVNSETGKVRVVK